MIKVHVHEPPIVTSLPFFLRMKARENCFHSALLYTEPKPSCCLFSPVSWVLGAVHSIIHSLADMRSCSLGIWDIWSFFCVRRRYCWASSLTVFCITLNWFMSFVCISSFSGTFVTFVDPAPYVIPVADPKEPWLHQMKQLIMFHMHIIVISIMQES